MPSSLRAPVLVPGVATGIGSLPHTDPRAAAEVVVRCLPEFPAAPQLPNRDPREGVLAQWLGALPELEIAPDGTVTVLGASNAAPECRWDTHAHAGLLSFLDVAAALDTPPVRVKAQITGPLTLGVALVDAGVEPARAFRRAAVATRAWAVAMEELVSTTASRRRPGRVLRRARTRPVAARQWPARSRSGDRRAVGRAGGRGVHDRRPRVRRRRPRARRSRPARRSSESKCGRSWCATRSRSRASSTATGGSPGVQCPPTARSANRRIRTGDASPRCGASSRGAAATRCRCARAG